MTEITLILTVLSILGVILNIKKKKLCFIIWAFTNFSWAIRDTSAGDIVLCLFYSCFMGNT